MYIGIGDVSLDDLKNLPSTGPAMDMWVDKWIAKTGIDAFNAQSGGFTSWLNQNAGKVAIGAAAVIGLALFSGGRR